MFFNDPALTAERFLADYWQKQPLLLRQALPGFAPELDANDIAGLACEEMAESRLVSGSYPENDWKVRYGPFVEDDLVDLPGHGWTLLVQDVEKHYPPLAALLRRFDFLPGWRIDDLMVSVAARDGSVGPHVDQYDVFLLQASGKRRWDIARHFDPERLPDCELNVLRHFTPERSWELEPGDMLYLPPGVAHHGVATEAGMTWSIGMRAPSAADLHQALGEWLAEQRDEGERYADPGLARAVRAGELDPQSVARFRRLVEKQSNNAAEWEAFLGAFLSRYRLAHEPAAPPTALDTATLRESLESGARLVRNPWTRLLWLDGVPRATLFAAGDAFACDARFAEKICDPAQLTALGSALKSDQFELLCRLVNRGHLYLEAV
ncbi:MAG: cupin domain-containing protein [Lysobacterales bacterium]